MFGFSSLGELAINEFPPFWIDLGPKTARVYLIPVQRGQASVTPALKCSIKTAPQSPG